MPAVLSVLSVSTAAAARVWMARLTGVWLLVTLLLLGRAFWLTYGKHRGTPWTRWIVWISALLVFLLWGYRF